MRVGPDGGAELGGAEGGGGALVLGQLGVPFPAALSLPLRLLHRPRLLPVHTANHRDSPGTVPVFL